MRFPVLCNRRRLGLLPSCKSRIHSPAEDFCEPEIPHGNESPGTPPKPIHGPLFRFIYVNSDRAGLT